MARKKHILDASQIKHVSVVDSLPLKRRPLLANPSRTASAVAAHKHWGKGFRAAVSAAATSSQTTTMSLTGGKGSGSGQPSFQSSLPPQQDVQTAANNMTSAVSCEAKMAFTDIGRPPRQEESMHNSLPTETVDKVENYVTILTDQTNNSFLSRQTPNYSCNTIV